MEDTYYCIEDEEEFSKALVSGYPGHPYLEKTGKIGEFSFESNNPCTYNYRDLFPDTLKFLEKRESVVYALDNMSFLCEKIPFPEFSLEEWKSFLEVCVEKRIISLVE